MNWKQHAIHSRNTNLVNHFNCILFLKCQRGVYIYIENSNPQSAETQKIAGVEIKYISYKYIHGLKKENHTTC